MKVKIIDGKHVHGKNLALYSSRQKGNIKQDFKRIENQYEKYRDEIEKISVLDADGIKSAVNALNEYRRVALPIFDKMSNAGQKALGYTIMEEFFYLIFNKKIEIEGINHDNLFVGKGNSYVSLSFTPGSFDSMFGNPNANIHTKDQDFVLGANVEIQVKAEGNVENTCTVIPVVAIECKTYLERNMLDSCAATAGRLKNAMPYCVYIVAAEYMKMTDAAPELTDIDEVYILCKAKNAEREDRKKKNLPPIDIDTDLVLDLYERVTRHLNAVWWQPDDAVMHGKIINRP